MGTATGAYDPSVADYRATSPDDGGGTLDATPPWPPIA